MVNSVISPTVTYELCSLKLPKGVLDNIDRARKQCLWRGNDNSKKGGNLVAWPTVMKPKLKGGLGIINLRLQNDALLLKHLHKFYSKEDIPWVTLVWNRYYVHKVPHAAREVGSFWWKDILRLSPLYRGIASCSLGDGSTVLFWNDLWADRILSLDFPHLFSFAKNDKASVKLTMSQTDLDTIFHLPLSQQAYDEFLDLQVWLQNIAYDPMTVDVWSFHWGNNRYSSRKFYQLAFQHLEAHPVFSWLWRSGCTPRVKFFGWLITVDRLNTKTMLKHRNFNVEDNDTFCVLCTSNCEEDIEHLFFGCEFAKRCWSAIGIQWDESIGMFQRLALAKGQCSLPFFTELVLIASWELWKIRNDKVFNRSNASFSVWLCNFRNQCLLQSIRFKEDIRSSFCYWLDGIS
jgi:hypothetical protein